MKAMLLSEKIGMSFIISLINNCNHFYSKLFQRERERERSLIYTLSLSIRRAHPTTFIPCLTRASAIPFPIPADAPVIKATRPTHLSISAVGKCTFDMYGHSIDSSATAKMRTGQLVSVTQTLESYIKCIW